ncbi:uncharacterized protein [Drosophila bipectinata]|uniref:uncharacterized protein n=1 Tax=Drosophila bipectinata TaxID=42026 RepID=UPI0038B2E919
MQHGGYGLASNKIRRCAPMPLLPGLRPHDRYCHLEYRYVKCGDTKNGAPQSDSNPNPDPSLPSNPMDVLLVRMESMFERMMETVMSQIDQMMATVCKSLCIRD